MDSIDPRDSAAFRFVPDRFFFVSDMAETF
jgi:hypothetical protein